MYDFPPHSYYSVPWSYRWQSALPDLVSEKINTFLFWIPCQILHGERAELYTDPEPENRFWTDHLLWNTNRLQPKIFIGMIGKKLFQIGDEIMEVNGISSLGLSPNDIGQVISSRDTLNIVVRRR